MRPIDQKMKYQIDKMIKSATTGIVGKFHQFEVFFLYYEHDCVEMSESV